MVYYSALIRLSDLVTDNFSVGEQADGVTDGVMHMQLRQNEGLI